MTVTTDDFNARERADAALVVRLLGTLALSASARPNTDVEARLLRACAMVTGDVGVVDGFACDCLAALVLSLIEHKDFDEAVAFSRREIALREELGHLESLAQAFRRQSHALESAGQFAEALEALAEALGAADDANTPDLTVTLLLDRARILGTRFGRFEEALQILQDAHGLGSHTVRPDIRDRVREQLELALTWILRSAGAAEDAGDTDTAAEHYLLVAETARTVGLLAFAVRAQCNHARMLAATIGRPDRALPLAQSALLLAREHGPDDLMQYATELILAIQRDLKNR